MSSSHSVLSFAGAAFRVLTLGLFVLFLVASLPGTARRVAERARHGVAALAEPPEAIRRRTFGSAYVDAVEGLRRAIPRDGEYLLVNAGTKQQGGPNWIRFELAPRRARFLGLWSELPPSETLRARLPAGTPVVIAFRDGAPPRLLDRESFLRQLDLSHGRL